MINNGVSFFKKTGIVKQALFGGSSERVDVDCFLALPSSAMSRHGACAHACGFIITSPVYLSSMPIYPVRHVVARMCVLY